MIVQDVVNAVYTNTRQVLANSGADALLYVPWVDWTQKECLHGSTYSYLLQNMQPVSLVSGTSSYALAQVPRRISLVYDRTFDRRLEEAGAMNSAPGGSSVSVTNGQWTEFWKRSGSNTIFVFPAPQKSIENATLEVHYEAYAPDLSGLTDTLLLPNDATDLVAAGVTMQAFAYLKLDSEAAFWQARYKDLKG